jgi:hypothetical protein
MNQLGNYCSTTTTTFFKNAFSIANNGNGVNAIKAANKYLKFVYIGIVAYSAYSTYRFFRARNKKELVKKELPEHIKYENGWYAELDEFKKMLIMPTPMLSDPPPVIQEATPRGEILMYYDVKNKEFVYYSNNKNLPYRTLDAVARKYVCLHNVPSIYVDIREEVKKGMDKCLKKIKGSSNKDTSTSLDAAKPTSAASSIFAVYKNYKSGATAATTSGADSNGIGKSSKKVILKDNVNKFIFKGRIDDYALDVKAREKKEKSSKTRNGNGIGDEQNGDARDEETEKEEINISYSEFKKRNARN